VSALNLCDGLVPLNEVIKSPIEETKTITVVREPIAAMTEELATILARAQHLVKTISLCQDHFH